MLDILRILVFLSCLFWVGALLQPWFPWLNREVLEKSVSINQNTSDLQDITVVIPARNEEKVIIKTLEALAKQGNHLKVIVVDDQSDDNTIQVAESIQDLDLQVVIGAPLQGDWAGKLWALEQGIQKAQTRYTLLLDADVCLEPGVISALLRMQRPFVSVMAELHMHSFWEKLLLPAFVLFFKSLYPFHLANSRWKRVSAAAGGCILIETRLFDQIGGLQAIHNALIDDCALVSRVKATGAQTWIGLSRFVKSIRPYQGLSEIWNMVARSAYTQLKYSPVILILLTVIMVILFWVPIFGAISFSDMQSKLLSFIAIVGMAMYLLPTLIFYNINPFYACLMPVIGAFYLGMTWHSAFNYYAGTRSQWKGRIYKSSTSPE
jgi:hopene-associated glycosyltransferase HpnB